LFEIRKEILSWTNRTTSVTGQNIIDFSIFINHYSEERGFLKEARDFAIDMSDSQILLNDKMAGYNQRNSLPPEVSTILGVSPANFGFEEYWAAVYHNPDGSIRGKMHYFLRQPSGIKIIRSEVGLESLESYKCVNLQIASPNMHEIRATVFFSPPHPIYNAFELDQSKGGPIIIAENEKMAHDYALFLKQKLNQHFVCVSWPGGKWAFRNVDWWALEGKDIILKVEANKDSVQLGYELFNILSDYRLRSRRFIFV
jgi:hypothetical protein